MIYDCFIFFNELDLLELRLEELAGIVDRFVLVESTLTFSGRSKPLVFSKNSQRFKKWHEKIIHVAVHDMPTEGDPWARERHQRSSIIRGLASAQPDDVIIISDADEIPRPEAVRSWNVGMGLCRFEQMFSYYWLNCVTDDWLGSQIATFGQYVALGGAQEIRQRDCPIIREGGWHFSFLGGSASIRDKIEAYSHQELNQEKFKSEYHLELMSTLGIDLFGRNLKFKFCRVNHRFPTTVQSNPEKYAGLICKAEFHEDWYSESQLLKVCGLLEQLRGKAGAVLEFGCWEGKSTIGLAHACYPETLLAVDTWSGNHDESPNHVSVRLAKERNIFNQFIVNTQSLTKGNVKPFRVDCHDFLKSWTGPVKFAHIDASHDYRSVKATIEMLLPWVVPGGVLCGDDFQSAAINRLDLDGGVERAVREILPEFTQDKNLWYYTRPNH